MQNITDSILNDPDYYPSNTDFTINYNLTVKEADGTFSYYSQNNMEKWFKENVDSSFSLTLRNETTAQGYIDQYREAMTANGGTVTYEKSYFVIQPQISFSIIEQSTGYVKVLVGGRGDKATDRPFQFVCFFSVIESGLFHLSLSYPSHSITLYSRHIALFSLSPDCL